MAVNPSFRAAAVCVGLLLLVCMRTVTLQWDADTTPTSPVTLSSTARKATSTQRGSMSATRPRRRCRSRRALITLPSRPTRPKGTASNEVIATIGGSVPGDRHRHAGAGRHAPHRHSRSAGGRPISARCRAPASTLCSSSSSQLTAPHPAYSASGSYGWPRADVGGFSARSSPTSAITSRCTAPAPMSSASTLIAPSPVPTASSPCSISPSARQALKSTFRRRVDGCDQCTMGVRLGNGAVASTTISGTVSDALHVYRPNPGSGQAAIFLAWRPRAWPGPTSPPFTVRATRQRAMRYP